MTDCIGTKIPKSKKQPKTSIIMIEVLSFITLKNRFSEQQATAIEYYITSIHQIILT